jgi:hypothetical protein
MRIRLFFRILWQEKTLLTYSGFCIPPLGMQFHKNYVTARVDVILRLGHLGENTKEEWLAVLRLANMWQFTNIRASALKEIDKRNLLSSIEKVEAGMLHDVKDWFQNGLVELLSLDKLIIPQENAGRLGVVVITKIYTAREKICAGDYDFALPHQNPWDHMLGDHSHQAGAAMFQLHLAHRGGGSARTTQNHMQRTHFHPYHAAGHLHPHSTPAAAQLDASTTRTSKFPLEVIETAVMTEFAEELSTMEAHNAM